MLDLDRIEVADDVVWVHGVDKYNCIVEAQDEIPVEKWVVWNVRLALAGSVNTMRKFILS